MIYWLLGSIILAVGFAVAAFRSESGETLGVKQALYVGSVCFVLFALYHLYQWNSAQTAPAEVGAYLPVYPASTLRTRVPVKQLRRIESLFSTRPAEENLKGQWIFGTKDSSEEVGKYYQKWARQNRANAGVKVMQEYSEVLLDEPEYSMTVTANSRWGETRITYTLMSPL